MRLLFATVLVTGCVTGDLSEPPALGRDDVNTPVLDGADGEPVSRLAPEVCATRAWRVRADAGELDLAVVTTATGASVFTVPVAGGAIRGFQVDGRGAQASALLTVRDDQKFVGVTAGVTDGRLVVAGQTGDRVTLDLVRDDLGAVHALGELEGTFAGQLPVVTSRDHRLAIAAGDDGVLARSFDGALWQATDSAKLAAEGAVSLASAAYLDDAMIVWSNTSGECHLRRVAAGTESVRKFGCDEPRLATDPARRGGTLVYEDRGDVYRTQVLVGGESELANRTLVATGASSPRVVFDGARTWISYVDARGDLVVGFLDARGELVSRAVEGVRPSRDGYELAAFGGGVWAVVSFDGIGIGAQRFCAVAQ